MTFRTDIYMDSCRTQNESWLDKLRKCLYELSGKSQRHAQRRITILPRENYDPMPSKRIFWKLASRGTYAQLPQLRAGDFQP